MAKGNMLLGMARGKVGSIVFSRSNGQQITRAKNNAPKNPRTESQCLQRALFATVAKAASGLYGIIDHSFQNVAYGQDSLNYFRKRNLDILRAAYLNGGATNFLTKGEDALPANEYLISQGSIAAPLVRFISYGGAEFPYFVASRNMDTDGQFTLSNLNAALGIKGGDQITLVAIVNRDDYEGTAEGFSRVVVHRAVILNGYEGAVFNQQGFVDGSYDPNVTTNTSFLIADYVANNTYAVSVNSDGSEWGLADGEVIEAVGIIISRYDDVQGKWLRSSCRMIVSPEVLATLSDGDQSAVNSYGNTSSDVSSDEYLNQAEGDASNSQVVDNSRGTLRVSVVSSDASYNKVKSVGLDPGEVFSFEDLPRAAGSYILTAKVSAFSNVAVRDFDLLTDDGFTIASAPTTAKNKIRTLSVPFKVSVDGDGGFDIETESGTTLSTGMMLAYKTVFNDSNLRSGIATLDIDVLPD